MPQIGTMKVQVNSRRNGRVLLCDLSSNIDRIKEPELMSQLHRQKHRVRIVLCSPSQSLCSDFKQ